ncbi:hypothetical protein LUZ63_002384 [Rhynchospora breviuscula]|uniref:Neprosin PEP catalytic domain-containing protein n=1 Tax=Rhynchospora breviuscula TaxID=2022672 RepID=A0A9Q0CZ63_9POAL|nr:hypothetical protein LUZ63_002384 [Rhynchospora breviuscula]
MKVQDQDTGDWSLYREDLGGPIGGMTLLGWWPKSLFRELSDHAEVIQWTGSIIHAENERSSPSMGSGHFASELDGKAASFNDCFGFDENGNVYKGDYAALSYESDRNCYSVSEWYETKHAAGRHFFYGGPGGCSEKN